jgi:chromosome segregation ATPase
MTEAKLAAIEKIFEALYGINQLGPNVYNQMKDDLKILRTIFLSQKEENGKLRQELNTVKDALEKQNDYISRLDSLSEAESSSARKLRIDTELQVAFIKTLKESESSLLKKNGELQRELDSVKDTLNDKDKIISDLANNINREAVVRLKLQEDLEKKSKIIIEQGLKLETLEVEKEGLLAEKNRRIGSKVLEEKDKEIAHLKQTQQAYIEASNEMMMTIFNLKEENKQLKQNVEIFEKADDTIDNLTKEVRGKTARIFQLEKDLLSEINAHNKFKDDYLKLKTENRELTDKLASALKKVQACWDNDQQTLKRMETQQTEIDKLKQQLEEKIAIITNVNNDLLVVCSSNQKLQEEYCYFKGTTTELIDKLAKSEKRVQEYCALGQENVKLKTECQETAIKIMNQQNEIKNLTEQIHEKEEKIIQLENDLRSECNARRRLAEANAELKAVKKEIENKISEERIKELEIRLQAKDVQLRRKELEAMNLFLLVEKLNEEK